MTSASKILLKRTADVLEKLAVGCILVGLFQQNSWGYIIGIGCLAASYYLSILEMRL